MRNAPQALKKRNLTMTIAMPEICTCATPRSSHVRPGICYACWKILREEAPDQAEGYINLLGKFSALPPRTLTFSHIVPALKKSWARW